MTRRTAAFVAVMSATGLLVSVLALVSSSQSRVPTSDQVSALGPAAVAAPAGRPSPRAEGRAERRAQPRPAPRDPARAEPARRIPISSAALGRRTTTRTARPLSVTIPSVQLRARVQPVGVTPDDQMQLPADPAVMGWYRFGAAPSAPTGGSVVLAGHLDSTRFGLGPLVRLRDVELGSTVTVVTSRGARREYVVRRIQRFDQQRLPAEVFARDGRELLRLITCGGAYDAETGYEQNLVVTAVPVR